MIDTRRRSVVAGAGALGIAALTGIGFWIGRANPGSTAHADVMSGTVIHVGGTTPIDEFVVDLDAHAGTKSYPLGPVLWTNGPRDSWPAGDITPPCIAVGHHITFGVVYVPHADTTTVQIAWVDCGGDIG
jgi:hypothetical protein